MSPDAADVDHLPPESRFAVRALAAGLDPDAIDALLRTQGASARGALRAAVRRCGGPQLPHAAGDDALLAALAPALDAAASPPRRVPGTACPGAEIVRDLAAGLLDGPLLLATVEHAADCPPCMTRLVAARRSPAPVPGGGETSRPARPDQRPVIVAVGLCVLLLALAGVIVGLLLSTFSS